MKKLNLKRANLAINGGDPVRTKGWLDNFTIGKEEEKAVQRVMSSGYLSLFEGSHTPDPPFSFLGGPEVLALENEWCEYYGAGYAVSVNSATSGLFAAMGALGVGYGDEVIVSPYTMSACALAPLIYGAIPVFADVDLETGCLCVKSIKNLISDKTKAILVVHQFGFPAEMDEIMALAKAQNIRVVEDCAQAHGAHYKGRSVGTIGDIGVFSLNVNKSIQTGEGGVCITNDDDLQYRLQLIRNHGEAVVGSAEYSHITNIAGYNYRMTEIGASIAREQLKKLEALNVKRLELVEYLQEGLERYDFLSPLKGEEGNLSTYYVTPIRFDKGLAGVRREEFVRCLKSEGVLFFEGYVKPLYLQPIYQQRHLFKGGYPFTAKENLECNMSFDYGTCPNAEKLHEEEMMISEHIRPPHTAKDIDDILEAIEKIALQTEF